MRGRRVLIIEDEVMIRWSIRDMLEDAGFECAEAADADEALAILDRGDWLPEVWVTDYNLGPGLRGDVLADEASLRLPGLPILHVTGNPECLAGRAFGPRERLLAKPFLPDALLAIVGELTALSDAQVGPREESIRAIAA